MKDKRDNTHVKISCIKCKGKQGIIRKYSTRIKCFVCGKIQNDE
jgi:ribosomal protein S27E